MISFEVIDTPHFTQSFVQVLLQIVAISVVLIVETTLKVINFIT